MACKIHLPVIEEMYKEWARASHSESFWFFTTWARSYPDDFWMQVHGTIFTACGNSRKLLAGVKVPYGGSARWNAKMRSHFPLWILRGSLASSFIYSMISSVLWKKRRMILKIKLECYTLWSMLPHAPSTGTSGIRARTCPDFLFLSAENEAAFVKSQHILFRYFCVWIRCVTWLHLIRLQWWIFPCIF